MDKHRTMYVNSAFPVDDIIRRGVTWHPEARLIEEQISSLPLSFKQPTEVVRFRFADKPDPDVHVQGRFPIDPTLGEPDADGTVQLGIGAFAGLIKMVDGVVDSIRKLPRVTD